MTVDYQVILTNIPSDEAVTKNDDDSFTIFINKNLIYEKQQKAFHHAMYHILHGHLENKDINVDDIEFETHNNILEK